MNIRGWETTLVSVLIVSQTITIRIVGASGRIPDRELEQELVMRTNMSEAGLSWEKMVGSIKAACTAVRKEPLARGTGAPNFLPSRASASI